MASIIDIIPNDIPPIANGINENMRKIMNMASAPFNVWVIPKTNNAVHTRSVITSCNIQYSKDNVK